MNEPWICPRCNTVNSPWSLQCFCDVRTFTTTTSGYPEALKYYLENKYKIYPKEIKDE